VQQGQLVILEQRERLEPQEPQGQLGQLAPLGPSVDQILKSFSMMAAQLQDLQA
jgi:hypothetical protein